ncbi:MAG: type II toxin-antitoxin system HipA family toxin [Alphaproteobacteria bacterium]|nr:type II toxin-antitoxin system HipA family toxin [Alphaproteobacteria bacterium]
MNLLDVYFHNKKVGVLKEHNSRLSFQYSDTATESIAHLLPLQKEAFGDKETRSFFINLLPEGDVARKIAQIKQVSLNNPFALLKELGGECAGAISLYPQDMEPVCNNKLEEISEDEVASLLIKLSRTPLLTGEGIRLSLAGAQDKLALTIFPDRDKYYKPSDKYISTWILKPENKNVPDLIYNEYFCMKLAGLMGLQVAECKIKKFGSVLAYMTKRFDRENDTTLQRIQQEDFCQGLGLSNKKYQRTEGGPSVKQCFRFIHDNFANKAKDELYFLKSIVFNFLIGNSDAHGKNFSYLHTANGYVLAPLYDLVSTQVYQGLAKEMSMAIGGEYEPDRVRRSHFREMAKEFGIKNQLIDDILDKLSAEIILQAEKLKEMTIEEKTYNAVYDKIIEIIVERAGQLS